MTYLKHQRFLDIVEQMTKSGQILVVGDIGIDKYTFGEVKRISPEAPVPVLEVSKEWLKLGLASNISHNLETLGIKSTLLGVVGSDSNADVLEGLLEEVGLSTWGIVRDAGRKTTFKERVTTDIQQVCRIDYETSQDLSPETQAKVLDRFHEFLSHHQSIILEDYSKGLLSDVMLQKMIALGKKQNVLVAVDPYRTKDARSYRGCHLLKPNLIECKLLVNSLGKREGKIEEMAKILLGELELEMIAVTLGPQGMFVADRKGMAKIVPTVATEVYDVSGAGDTSISVLTAALMAGAKLDEAAFVANCAAGVVVGKKGTAIVTSEELVSFFENVSRRKTPNQN